MTEYEIRQRVARLAPANVPSAERWAHHIIEGLAREGLVVSEAPTGAAAKDHGAQPEVTPE